MTMSYGVLKSLILAVLASTVIFVFGGCKSSDNGFALPKERTGFFSKARAEERSRKWGEKRLQWQRNEDRKAKEMFDRVRGGP
jgi:hypothetical protein